MYFRKFLFLIKVEVSFFLFRKYGAIYTPLMQSFENQFKFNNIFRFLFLRVLSCSLISWVDSLGDEFVASHT